MKNTADTADTAENALSESRRNDLDLKCATVSIIGRPSSGKSTFLNSICENKVSITSPTPQTTRNQIKGIYTDVRGQLVFVDTPGIHQSEALLNKRLLEVALDALKDNDIVLYMVDPTREPGAEEKIITSLVQRSGRPLVICINKSDIATAAQIERARVYLASEFPAVTPMAASSLEDSGLDEILIALFALAGTAPLLYPPEAFTDQDLDFRVAEIIREKAMSNMRAELPHSLYVEIEDLHEVQDASSRMLLIRATINVEHDSQKGIIVGSGGSNIKRIRVESAKDIRRIFSGTKLQLDIRVKVSPNWRHNAVILKSLIQ
ncbi:MAG: GTPase Era [Sphaerochaetaceae bacterium]